ncbi:O-antigen ligase family protein [Actinotalea ferrariae]|uniref:O-antigen ligase family protein n=1 Tax=Actinotalea ferrariae TaxID=1386098 RepID=UPI001C8BFC1F|nr:O-antigen ligase family protein [Actinotalea ferrariae]
MLVLVAAFAVYLVLPGELALVGPLRSNGSPLRLLGLLALFLVLAGFLRADTRLRARPVAWVAVAYLGFAIVAWTTANTRLLSADQSAQMDRSVLIVLSGVGITLLGAVVVRDLRDAHRLVGWLAAGAVLCAVVGGLQFAGVIDKWADIVELPFMTTVVSPMGVVDRLGLNRVPGTTSSPLEYSVVLAVLLPLLVHLVLHAGSVGARRAAGAAAAVVMLALPLGFSRSGLLTLAVTVLVLLVFLLPVHRLTVLLTLAFAAAGAVVAAPQIIGVFRELITGAQDDLSIRGRLVDYPEAFERFEQAPWWGNGPSDAPLMENILDNQWLVTLVRDGLVGVLGLAILILGGAALAAWSAGRAAPGSPARTFNGALCAGLLGTAVAAGTFDLLAFQQATFAVFLLLALVGVGVAHSGDSAAAEGADATSSEPPR